MSVLEVFIGKERATLTELVGKGGEGRVYAIKDRPDQAAKIYHPNLRTKREDKIRAMVGAGLAATTNLVAYPAETVTDLQGNFLGFAMWLVLGYRPLHELYNPKSRQRHFPKADYRFLVLAAQNIASAVGTVHRTECVIGDLNHSGVLVAQDATVALIDADSFQFGINGKLYYCKVGVQEYTPPELQKKNLERVHRTKAHDNFGLAVAVFHLLFMGCHPFAGRHEGPDVSIGTAIAENRFAFSLARQRETGASPPRGALTLDLFPYAIIQSFEKAFGLTHGTRPGARDWIKALRTLANDLNHCSNYMTHHYPSSARNCPWCALERNSSFDMFPGALTAGPKIRNGMHVTEQEIHDILAWSVPSTEKILPPRVKPLGASSELRDAMARKWWNLFIKPKFPDKQFIEAFKDADKQVQLALDEFVRRNNATEAKTNAKKLHRELKAEFAAYDNNKRALDRELNRELKNFESSRKTRQRNEYLNDFSIRSADISGIGIVSTYTLLLFGIQTASDIKRSAVLRVPGIDDDMADKLLNWRCMHELQFRYDPTPNEQDIADAQALKDQFAAKKIELDSKLNNKLRAFLRIRARLNELPARARSDAALNRALDCRAQAARDLELLEVSVPDSTVEINLNLPEINPDPPPGSGPRWYWWIPLAPVVIVLAPVAIVAGLFNGSDKNEN